MPKKGYKQTEEHKRHLKENHADFSGKNHPNYQKRFLFTCQHCGKTKKCTLLVTQTQKYCSLKCLYHANSGINHPGYKGIKIKRDGVWYIWTNNKRQRQSRYIAECYLHRKLKDTEIVHHINEDPSDDRLENLYLFSTISKHISHHNFKKTPSLISNLI